jgi:ABC-type transport system substrate-binding protein
MKMDRRQFLGSAAAAGAAAVLSTTLVGPSMAQGQTMRVALAARGTSSLLPASPKTTGASSWPIYHIYDTLVKSPDGTFATRPEEFEPMLAESWETDETGLVWTYKLRSGVKFHKDNGELTADDVVFSYNRHLDPNMLTLGKSTYANIQTVEAVDALTVRFILKKPDPFLGSVLAGVGSGILCKAAFEAKGEEAFEFDPIGTGPYQFLSGTPDAPILLEAFSDYFDGVATIPNIQVDYIADTTARTLAFASGQADVIEGVRSPGWVDSIRQRSPNTIFDATKPGSHNYLQLNLNVEPLNNLLVRQAIRYAINGEQLAASFDGLAAPMTGLLADGVAGAAVKEDLPPELQYEPSIDKAKELLAEAGYPNGFTLPVFMSQREDYSSIMLMIQEQLRAAGIILDMRIVDHNAYHTESRKDLNTMYLNSISYPPVPTQPFVDQMQSSAEVKSDGSGGQNLSHYGVASPGIDNLLSMAMDQADFNERAKIVNEMERQVLTDLPNLGIITLSYVAARNPRLDLGYEVTGGLPVWRFNRAKFV